MKASGSKLRAGRLEQLDDALIFEYSRMIIMRTITFSGNEDRGMR